MPTLEECRAEQRAKDASRLARLQAEHDARRKEMPARRESVCPQHKQDPDCLVTIRVGDPIVQPYERNTAGGNRFSPFWYCKHCGDKAHADARPEYVRGAASATAQMLRTTHAHLLSEGPA